MTNFEKIREMSVEEFANFINNLNDCDICIFKDCYICNDKCCVNIRKWLESEVEEE